MKFYLSYLTLELKRITKLFPKILLGAVVFLLLCATLSFAGQMAFYSSVKQDKATVAFVVEDDSPLIGLATSMIQSSKSVRVFCDFVNVDKEEGKRLLDKGEVFAMITITDRFFYGLGHGEPARITVEFYEGANDLSALLAELCNTTSKILTTNQVATYAQADFYNSHNASEDLPAANKVLNSKFIATALARTSIIKESHVEKDSGISLRYHYYAGGVVIFLLLLSMCFAGNFFSDNRGFRLYLRANHISAPLYLFTKGLVIFFVFAGIYLSLGIAGIFLELPFLRGFFINLAVLFILAYAVQFLYQLGGTGSGGILLLFFVAMITLILGGYVLPGNLLPSGFHRVNTFLPISYLAKVFSHGIAGKHTPGLLLPMVPLFIFIFGCSTLLDRRKIN